MNLKSAFSSNSDDAILQEAIRGEKAALEDYNNIIQNADFTPSTKKVLEKQRDSVQSALDMVKTVEDFI